MEYVITFNNTNHAIKAEHCLLDHSLHAGVLPLPAQIKAGCGICLRIRPDELNVALKVLADSGINDIGVFSRETVNNAFVYTKERS